MAQQQCVGPLQLPISNVAVMAQSHFGLTGAATAIGEQPLKGLINPAAMARLCLGEALTNLVWAQSTGLADIKASVNWMYAAKMASEGVAMYEAATALKDAMVELQVMHFWGAGRFFVLVYVKGPCFSCCMRHSNTVSLQTFLCICQCGQETPICSTQWCQSGFS